jgi:N-succinyl-L-ornithine transcarbamylase|tara:strand:- start:3912 stop:4862 length:951 start_codon:yes stop_codon:yes gene_type:complete
MKNFIKINDILDYNNIINQAIELKRDPYKYQNIGHNKTLGLIFFNPSLRTRLSTQKAAIHLGMKTMIMNFNSEGWGLEYENKTIMSGNNSEHVKEAAQVISQYCDIVGIRAFSSLKNKIIDESEKVINSFIKYASIPILNMESSIAHPLQALTDAITIKENIKTSKPKIVLSWAPHPKALPHAVANSFVNMMKVSDYEFVIANPEGYNLNPEITQGIKVIHDQKKAFKNADFIYAKNWSSYDNYGEILIDDNSWLINAEKMKLTNNGKFMHCLPVRRNFVVSDAVLDSNNSLVIQQANNRTYAAQIILKKMISNER